MAEQSDGTAQGANTGRNFTNIFFPKPQHSECVVSVSVSDAERSRTSRRESGDPLVVGPCQTGSGWSEERTGSKGKGRVEPDRDCKCGAAEEVRGRTEVKRRVLKWKNNVAVCERRKREWVQESWREERIVVVTTTRCNPLPSPVTEESNRARVRPPLSPPSEIRPIPLTGDQHCFGVTGCKQVTSRVPSGSYWLFSVSDAWGGVMAAERRHVEGSGGSQSKAVVENQAK